MIVRALLLVAAYAVAGAYTEDDDAQIFMQLSAGRAIDNHDVGEMKMLVPPRSSAQRASRAQLGMNISSAYHHRARQEHHAPPTLGQIYDIITKLFMNPELVGGLMAGDVTQALLDLSADEVAPLSRDHRTDSLLQGHSLQFANTFVIVMICIVLMLPLVGMYFEKYWALRDESRKRFSLPVAFLLLASYICWIPAMFSLDFSFNLGLIIPNTGGYRFGLTVDRHNNYEEGPIHESTRSLVAMFRETGKYLGAFLVALYAFAVPGLKIILLALGEYFRFGPSRQRVEASRLFLSAMRFISKWAAPDMFAYCLLSYLCRHMQRLPVSTLSMFDVGFTSFSVFIVTCALSSALIPLPELPELPEQESKQEHQATMRMGYLKRSSLPFLAAFLTIGWGFLFVVGIFTPCFAMTLSEQQLIEHTPAVVYPLFDIVNLNEIIPNAEVGVWTATWANLGFLGEDRDLNFLLAFVMLFVFALVMTIVSMASLLQIVWQVRKVALAQEEEDTVPDSKPLRRAIDFAELVKHMAMMDVLIMGVIVATIVMSIHKDYGIVCSIKPGLWILIASEVLHYLSHYLVIGVAESWCACVCPPPIKATLGCGYGSTLSLHSGGDGND